MPRLFGEPFTEVRFDLFLRDGAVDAGIFQSPPYLVQDIQMVLDIFHRAVVREFVQKLFNVMFCGAHGFAFPRIALVAMRVRSDKHSGALRGVNRLFGRSQDLCPGLSYVAPSGLVFVSRGRRCAPLLRPVLGWGSGLGRVLP